MALHVSPDTFIVGAKDTSDKLTTIVNILSHNLIVSVLDNVKVKENSKAAIYHRCQRTRREIYRLCHRHR